MTDHIPLAEAKPGDMVFLKPQHVFWVCPNATHVTADSKYGRVPLEADWIDHIERPARVLKVGDWVTDGASIREGEIVFMEGNEAVIRTSDSGIWVYALTDLEPVE